LVIGNIFLIFINCNKISGKMKFKYLIQSSPVYVNSVNVNFPLYVNDQTLLSQAS